MVHRGFEAERFSVDALYEKLLAWFGTRSAGAWREPQKPEENHRRMVKTRGKPEEIHRKTMKHDDFIKLMGISWDCRFM